MMGPRGKCVSGRPGLWVNFSKEVLCHWQSGHFSLSFAPQTKTVCPSWDSDKHKLRKSCWQAAAILWHSCLFEASTLFWMVFFFLQWPFVVRKQCLIQRGDIFTHLLSPFKKENYLKIFGGWRFPSCRFLSVICSLSLVSYCQSELCTSA